MKKAREVTNLPLCVLAYSFFYNITTLFSHLFTEYYVCQNKNELESARFGRMPVRVLKRVEFKLVPNKFTQFKKEPLVVHCLSDLL